MDRAAAYVELDDLESPVREFLKRAHRTRPD
jgi:hypothetical protein